MTVQKTGDTAMAQVRRMNEQRVDREARQFHDWVTTAVRFITLASAGGATAVLAFVGTAMSGPPPSPTLWPVVVPLVLFVLGLCAAFVVVLGQMFQSFIASTEDAAYGQWAEKHGKLAVRLGAFVAPKTGTFILLSFGCFLLGCAFGVGALVVVV